MSDGGLQQQHPEADLLAGFAESTLTQHEREGVLRHLAVCEHCRQVVFLAHQVEPAPDTQISKLKARPFWRRNWFPLMASASVVVALAVITFSWYGQFHKQTTSDREVAQQRTATPMLAANEMASKDVALPPPTAAKRDGRSVTKQVPAERKAKQAVASTSSSAVSNSVGAAGEEVRRHAEEAQASGSRRYQAELRLSSPSQNARSTVDIQSSPGSSPGTGDKMRYSYRAMQPANVGRQTKDGFDAPLSCGAVTRTQAYSREQAAPPVESSPAEGSQLVHAEGCVAQGVEAGCLMVKDRESENLYQLLFKGSRPQPGNGIEFTGVPHDGPTSCMQGIPLDVIKWVEKSSVKCAQSESPKK
jgi:hypothetical protein